MIPIRIETRGAISEMRKEFSHLSGREFNKGVARALNRTITKVRTDAGRSLRGQYKIKAMELKKRTAIHKARPDYLVAEIVWKGRPLPLKLFKPSQKARGVSVNITGRRKTIRGAFLATMSSGHMGVFARGRYQQGEFIFRKHRARKFGPDLPITEMVTTSVPIMVQNQNVIDQISNTAGDVFPKRLEHELNYISSKL